MKNMPLLMIAILALTVRANAESLKADPLAARGCMQRISLADAQATISRFNLRTRNAKPAEVITLGTSLNWMEKLNGGQPLSEVTQEPGGYTYAYNDAHSNSEQQANQIAINRHGEKEYGMNQAQLIHELAHLFGNRGGYEAYRQATGGKYCIVSRYSSPYAVQPGTIRWHEQFAEVFAAYVTRPSLIKNSTSPACQDAFRFFSTVVFPHSAELANTCASHQSAIEKKISTTLVSNTIGAKPALPNIPETAFANRAKKIAPKSVK